MIVQLNRLIVNSSIGNTQYWYLLEADGAVGCKKLTSKQNQDFIKPWDQQTPQTQNFHREDKRSCWNKIKTQNKTWTVKKLKQYNRDNQDIIIINRLKSVQYNIYDLRLTFKQIAKLCWQLYVLVWHYDSVSLCLCRQCNYPRPMKINVELSNFLLRRKGKGRKSY